MRRCLLAAGLFVACAPRAEPEALRRVATEVVAVYHDWDDARFAGLFAGPKEVTPSRDGMAWMRERLGDCGAPEPMWIVDAQNGRFSAPCERGALEVHLGLNRDGRIVKLRHGAAGVAPEEPLASAVAPAIAALPAVEAPGFKDREFAAQLGRCELDRTWVVSEFGGLFHLRCEGGAAVMKLMVRPTGAVRSLELHPPPPPGHEV